jgi:dihydroneopterin aldolase
MPHYAHVLSVSRLELSVHIGFYEEERNKKQAIEVSFRLYFPDAIACNHDDNAAFFDYGALSDCLRAFADTQKFNLIEYMSMAMFRHLREEIDRRGGQDAKLWLQLNKINAPVPGLKDGASFFHSDLPPDATFIPSVSP